MDWEAASALATVAAVIVALFGSWINSWFYKIVLDFTPRLLLSTGGIESADPDNPKVRIFRPEKYWAYAITVRNPRRWFKLTNAQIFVIDVKERRIDGVYDSIWSGALPLLWQDRITNSGPRTIGPNATADLCSVFREKWLELGCSTSHREYEQLRWRRGSDVHLILTIQARGDEADSVPLRIQIDWDSGWDDEREKMQGKFIAKGVA